MITRQSVLLCLPCSDVYLESAARYCSFSSQPYAPTAAVPCSAGCRVDANEVCLEAAELSQRRWGLGPFCIVGPAPGSDPYDLKLVRDMLEVHIHSFLLSFLITFPYFFLSLFFFALEAAFLQLHARCHSCGTIVLMGMPVLRQRPDGCHL